MNTAHFAITSAGKLVLLGYGPETVEVGNALADVAETVSRIKGEAFTIDGSILNISDLYRLKAEITVALDNLDNEALLAEWTENPPVA